MKKKIKTQEEYIEEVLAKAPPLSDEKRALIERIFATALETPEEVETTPAPRYIPRSQPLSMLDKDEWPNQIGKIVVRRVSDRLLRIERNKFGYRSTDPNDIQHWTYALKFVDTGEWCERLYTPMELFLVPDQ